MRRELIVAMTAAALAACGPQAPADAPAATAPPSQDTAQAPALPPVTPADYSQPSAWLCRPEAEDACEQVATATSVSAGGQLVRDRFVPAADPKIDCFYVYPTVSRDETANADIAVGPEENEIARQQVARFGEACRIFAPLYRQVTIPALRRMLAGEDPGSNREMAYADVKAAFDHYYQNDNNGRGFILIGHSQGAGVLTRLIASEIDGKPAQDRMLSAMLIGGNLEVPAGAVVGGAFKTVPLCQKPGDIFCAIAYASFRAETPPPADSLFGDAETQGMKAACVNPAEIDGSAGELKAMLPVGTILFDELAPPAPWTADNTEVESPFVSLPGMLSARCVDAGGYNYLAVTVKADPADKRTDSIHGDVVIDGKVQPQWGLHLIDVNLAMGNLVAIAKAQGAEWIRRQPGDRQLPPEFQKPR